MNRIGLVLLVLFRLLSAMVTPHKPISYEGYRVYEVIEDEVNGPRLSYRSHGVSILNENSVYSKEGLYTVRSCLVPSYCEEEFRRALDAAEAVYNISIFDVEKLIQEEKMGIVSRASCGGGFKSKIYLSYHEMIQYLTYIAEIENPANGDNLAIVEKIGTSYEGRAVFGVKISSGFQEQKPIILFEAGIHAREWTAPASALYMISQLVENYTNNAHVLRNTDFYIIPLSNPDGYEYSRTKDRLWRKTRSTYTAGCYGVDANRNFDFHWGEKGASSDPASDVYKGPAAFSEREARNIRDVGKKYHERLSAFVSIHAYGSYILYPWGYTKRAEAPDALFMRFVAEKASEAIRKFGGTVFKVGPSSVILYEAAGGTDDYFKGVLNVTLTYTVELTAPGLRSFIVAPDKVYKVVAEAFEGYKIVAEYAANDKCKRKHADDGIVLRCDTQR